MGPTSIDSIIPSVYKFVEVLREGGWFGVGNGLCKISDVTYGCPVPLGNNPYCDRFKVHLPICGHFVVFEVVFNAELPGESPDFLFPQDPDFNPDPRNLTHLMTWDSRDTHTLLYALQELYEEYKRHNLTKLKQYSMLTYTYDNLKDIPEICKDEIEVLFVKNAQGTDGCVNFMIRLNIDFSGIPPYLTKDNPGEDSAILKIEYRSPEGNDISPQLFLSPRVEHALGGSQHVGMPPYQKGSCLSDYVPLVTSVLTNRVEDICEGFKKRREYVSAFQSYFGRSILEFDAERFHKVSFLFDWNDFFFMVHIELSCYYPNEPPKMSLQSIYHEEYNAPYIESVECPFSPRWGGDELAEKTNHFIAEYISKFQRQSVQSGTLKSKQANSNTRDM